MTVKVDIDRDVERYRLADQTVQSSARWLAGAFGAIAVVLVAGLSLSNLGVLSWWRLVLAVTGVAIGLSTTAVLIWRTAGVWVTGFLSFGQLEAAVSAEVAHLVRDDGTVVVGGTANELGVAVKREFGRYGSETARNYPSPDLLRGYLGHLERTLSDIAPHGREWLRLREERAEAEKVAGQMLAYANSYLIARNYRALRDTAKWAGVVFAVGTGLFAWAANPPKPPAPQEPTTVRVEADPNLASIERELKKLSDEVAELQETPSTTR